MSAQVTEKGVDELQRIERDFSQQRDALHAEAARISQRLLAWRGRREAIDDALQQLRARLSEPSGPKSSRRFRLDDSSC
ncbi:hypothetical protein [Planctomicrobium piriforme]|uniref:Uncharacterized protein n=1 Tax=Planctomicrobium piriforme TaxID=1576369 RepID=A0A1I3AYW1_9PLAN|nr:hypothetical protein [Planctomicrobium piriforme]SFH55275.1 hypothetical protein SAMN05421753_101132 [Planctomicrobium piriforme]